MVFCFSFAENHTLTTHFWLRSDGYLKRTPSELAPEAVSASGLPALGPLQCGLLVCMLPPLTGGVIHPVPELPSRRSCERAVQAAFWADASAHALPSTPQCGKRCCRERPGGRAGTPGTFCEQAPGISGVEGLGANVVSPSLAHLKRNCATSSFLLVLGAKEGAESGRD